MSATPGNRAAIPVTAISKEASRVISEPQSMRRNPFARTLFPRMGAPCPPPSEGLFWSVAERVGRGYGKGDAGMQPPRDWVKGRASLAPDEGLHQSFARVAKANPDAVALVSGDRSVSYRELDRMTDGWAADLAAAGARRGTYVPILLPRSIELVHALLAGVTPPRSDHPTRCPCGRGRRGKRRRRRCSRVVACRGPHRGARRFPARCHQCG